MPALNGQPSQYTTVPISSQALFKQDLLFFKQDLLFFNTRRLPLTRISYFTTTFSDTVLVALVWFLSLLAVTLTLTVYEPALRPFLTVILPVFDTDILLVPFVFRTDRYCQKYSRQDRYRNGCYYSFFCNPHSSSSIFYISRSLEATTLLYTRLYPDYRLQGYSWVGSYL